MTRDQLRSDAFAAIDDLLSRWMVAADAKKRLVALRAAMNDPAEQATFDAALDAVLKQLEKRK